LGISKLPFESFGTKCHLDVGLMERHIIYYKRESSGFREKCHLDVGFVERHIIYYKGEGDGFPQVAVMSLVSSRLPVVHPSTKSVQTMH
jgi:hypothetical protein